jgi:phenylpyruvate tautomerase PptA (4-oxalocrotonate tautomerase family)
MPIIRVDIPEGHPREARQRLKRMLEECVARTWAKEHIYVALHEMLAEPADGTAIITVDLRPGRGKESERARALYREALEALQSTVGTDPERFVLLIREFPEWAFVVSGGKSLPPLGQITPALDKAA